MTSISSAIPSASVVPPAGAPTTASSLSLDAARVAAISASALSAISALAAGTGTTTSRHYSPAPKLSATSVPVSSTVASAGIAGSSAARRRVSLTGSAFSRLLPPPVPAPTTTPAVPAPAAAPQSQIVYFTNFF